MKRIVYTLAALVAVVAARPAAAQSYVVIANPSVSASSASKAELSKVFMKQSNKLGGASVTPVDLKGGAARDAFSKEVHGKASGAVSSYWQQQIFAGKDVPPAQKGSDAEVIAFVKSTPGAIGYVSGGAALDGVKKISVQ